MSDKKPEKDKQVTPEGAVEIEEEQLDQASGGLEEVTLNYSKMLQYDPTTAPSDPTVSEATLTGKKI